MHPHTLHNHIPKNTSNCNQVSYWKSPQPLTHTLFTIHAQYIFSPFFHDLHKNTQLHPWHIEPATNSLDLQSHLTTNWSKVSNHSTNQLLAPQFWIWNKYYNKLACVHKSSHAWLINITQLITSTTTQKPLTNKRYSLLVVNISNNCWARNSHCAM